MTETSPPVPASVDYLGLPYEPAAGLPVDIVPFGTVRAWTGSAPLPWCAERLLAGAEAPIDWREHDLHPTPNCSGAVSWLPLPGYGSAPATIGVEWPEPRDVYAVVVEYRADAAPRPEDVDLQYWWWSWPTPLPQPGREGWTRIDDKWCGYWNSADDRIAVDGSTHVHTFAPLTPAEIAHADGIAVSFRRTLKIRLAYPAGASAAITRLRVFTGSRWQDLTVQITSAGTPDGARWDGQVAVTNGVLLDLRPAVAARGTAEADAGKACELRLLATDAGPDNGDLTIVTVPAAERGCSFLTHDLRHGPIDVRTLALRVEAVNGAAREPAGQTGETTVMEAVLAQPEQTLERAMAEIPRLQKTAQRTPGQRYVPLAAASNVHKFALQYNGHVFCDRDRHKPKRDYFEGLPWPGDRMAYRFGTGDPPDFREREDAATQSLLDGYLPIVQTRWEDGAIAYEQEAFASLLGDGLAHEERKRGDEPAVLLLRFMLTNRGTASASARLWLQMQPGEALAVQDGAILATAALGTDSATAYEAPRLRAQVLGATDEVRAARLEGPADDAVLYAPALPPGGTATLTLAIPFASARSDDERAAVQSLDYEAKRAVAIAYWRAQVEAGEGITVPEQTVNAFYRAVIPHILISTDQDVPTGLSMNPAATYLYGVFANETCIQARMLDMRGYHDLARRYLEPFLHYQGGTPPMPGRFGSQRGVLHSAGPYTHVGYNTNHGWILWTLAEHYRFTRDAAWLWRVSPHLVEGCSWIIQERRATMRSEAPGQRAHTHGLLPPGHLEDPAEWFYWFAVNAHAYRGLSAVADVLAAVGHAESARLGEEAAAYREDIRAAVQASIERCPVVRLRDGTYAPYVPTRADIRGRDVGWIREVLYGPTHLIECGVLAPDEPEATWMLQDHEDNLLLSTSHGLGAPGDNWFSCGGITHQPNLLNTPLIYLRRDEIPLALRAFYNTIAASLYPDVNVFAEWLPAFGIGGGPFYKTPDEAAWIVWMRSLLVLEEGDRLWLAKGTPRRWLQHGQEVRVEGLATHFGPVSFHVVSAVRNGIIRAAVDLPQRNPPASALLRVRHPEGTPMRMVTCNGRPWERFDPRTETVDLGTGTGLLRLEVHY